jgi:hypothetical protein
VKRPKSFRPSRVHYHDNYEPAQRPRDTQMFSSKLLMHLSRQDTLPDIFLAFDTVANNSTSCQ